MQEFVTQLMLPVVLAFVMFSMGIGLSLNDFRRVLTNPRAVCVGLMLQLCLLPILALAIAYFLNLSLVTSLGLFLLSLCPGGATSNFFSYIAKGNVALSISLTAITCLIIPFTLPVLFVGYVSMLGNQEYRTVFDVPLALMIKQLMVVTIVPTLLGMGIKHCFTITNRREKQVKKLATVAMIATILLLIFVNFSVVQSSLTTSGIAAVLLCVFALTVAYVMAKRILTSVPDIRTIALEVGVQNAGTAMFVAYIVLKRPELASIPLMYGLLMNVPVFLFIGWLKHSDK